jgi:hypothetical protein
MPFRYTAIFFKIIPKTTTVTMNKILVLSSPRSKKARIFWIAGGPTFRFISSFPKNPSTNGTISVVLTPLNRALDEPRIMVKTIQPG